MVDIGVALFAFGIFALAMENYILAAAACGIAVYCVA